MTTSNLKMKLNQLPKHSVGFTKTPHRGKGGTFGHFLNPHIVNKQKGTDDCNKKRHAL
jgi:hypothetical protein